MDVSETLGGASVVVTATAADVEAARKAAAGASADATAAPPAETPPETENQPSRPEWVPEAYWNAETGEINYEGMAKRLSELEQPKPADDGKPVEEKPKDEKPADDPKVDVAATFGALTEKATAELVEKGELSEETFAAYEGMGLKREQLETYVEGIRAIQELRGIKAHTEAGGAEQYAAMVAWAKTSMSVDEITAYNRAVETGTEAELLFAVRGLRARYAAENGSEGRPLTAGRPGATAGDTFKDRAELVKAMSDPRYRTDAAYRNEVGEKLRRSVAAGAKLGLS